MIISGFINESLEDKVESEQLALIIIDGASIKPGETITFEVAKFELKFEYNTIVKAQKVDQKRSRKSKFKDILFYTTGCPILKCAF